MGTRRIKPRTKPPKKQPNKGNTALSWWDKHSQNNKYRYGILLSILSLFLIIWIVIGAVNLTVKPVETTVTDTPAPPAQTPPAVNSSPTQSEEDSYRQWLKEDYKRWENAMGSSSQLYQLYTGAQAKKPPAKYYEFHQHYIKSYYYYYKAALASEQDNIDDVGYYTDLAFVEDEKLLEYMPDYAQLTYHD
jgi:hypothetical protein